MKSFVSILAVGLLAMSGADAALLMSSYTSGGSGSYGQNFDGMATNGLNTWTDDSTVPGWYAESLQAGDLTSYRGTNGGSNAGAVYSFGTDGVAERALGSISSGTPVEMNVGGQFRNDLAQDATALTFTLTGEQWRNGGNTTAHSNGFYYLISPTEITGDSWTNRSGWTSYALLNILTPTVGATASALDGNAGANQVDLNGILITGLTVPVGQYLAFKWLDLNETGNDHGMGIDDVTITWSEVPEPATMSMLGLAGLLTLWRRRRADG